MLKQYAETTGLKLFSKPSVCAEARSILIQLGVPSFQNLSSITGVNHVTLSYMLYKPAAKRTFCGTRFATVFETLCSLYHARAKYMTKSQRSYVYNWIRQWGHRMIEQGTAFRRQPTEQGLSKNAVRQRTARRAERVAQYSKIVERFKYE